MAFHFTWLRVRDFSLSTFFYGSKYLDLVFEGKFNTTPLQLRINQRA